MGLPTFCRAYLKSTYLPAFSFKCQGNPTVCVYDLMKDLKYMPDTITTLDDAVAYLVGKIRSILFKTGSQIRTIVVLVDRAPPVVKRMVTHTTRYKGKDVFDEDGGPYLPAIGSDLIPTPWIRFAGNYKLLQRELYPRLFNAFMELVPRPGQTVILHGFPGYSEWITVYRQQAYASETNDHGQVRQVHMWRPGTELPITAKQEAEDTDLYNRVYIVENIPPCSEWPQGYIRKEEWVDAKNDISEADGAMFFYDHWFQNEDIMVVCNDGDVFSYALLYAYERVTGRNTFRNNHYICIPFKTTKGTEFFPDGEVPRYEYVDVNRLYIAVKEDASMLSAGVQNHVLTLVFLLIVAGSDFFQGAYKGLGAENVVWKTFFANLSQFSHMVQMSKGVTPSTRTPRTIVLDEDMFRLFVHYCYLEKYGKQTRKRLKRDADSTDISHGDLKVQCSMGKKAQSDPDYQLPSRNKIRLWARQLEWNALYYKNTPFGNQYSPTPFEMWEGLPYYPYIINPDTGDPEMTEMVAARSKPVDEVLAQHLYRNKRERFVQAEPAGDKEERKRRLVEKFDK